MELLRLSKFKLQLGALISQVRDLKEREQCATQQVDISIQKQKQSEEQFSTKLQQLHAELDSSHELRHHLQTKVQYLENDNLLLENKQKELKGTIDSMLQSRESFLSLYEDSTCEMRRSIEIRDRKIALLSENIHNHLLLFDSIGREAASVKQVVDNVQRVVSEKEDIVTALKRKMDQVSTFEKEFIDKIVFLENKLRTSQDELRRKDTSISELQGQLEAENITNNCRPQIKELQKALLLKEEVIENLTAEKKALHFDVRRFEIILQKIQNAYLNMDAEDKKIFSSALEGQKECGAMDEKENDRTASAIQESREDSIYKDTEQGAAENTVSIESEECNSAANQPKEECNTSCIYEHFVHSPPQTVISNPQSATGLNVYVDGNKVSDNQDNCTPLINNHLDSESSTTEAASENPAKHV